MSSSIANFVDTAPVARPEMYLAHTTDLHAFRTIVSDSTIKTRDCKVFGSPLSYFFYGRPAYRANPKAEPNSITAFYLITLLVELEPKWRPNGIMPFDSGAMHNGIFQDVLHPNMTLSAFELGSNPQVAGKVVSTFFGSNRAYFDGEPKPNVAYEPMELEVDAYLAMLGTRGKTPYDDRRCCIEFKFDADLELTRSNVKAVILPKALMRDSRVQDFIQRMDAQALTYTVHHARPSEDVRAIVDRAEAFYEANKIIL